MPSRRAAVAPLALLLACDDGDPAPEGNAWECVIEPASDPDYAQQLGCLADYEALASEPPDASIPGATSVKTLVDRLDGNELYFQNSQRYCVHWDFASTHLSGNGLPVVPELSSFNESEYYSPDRRFLLGALSYYEGPRSWVYEISPYDTADAEMITAAFQKIQQNVWVGEKLAFHPTSSAVENEAEKLGPDVPVISTDTLYEGIDYQPLNNGTTTGILTFHSADEVDAEYTPYREVVVLDSVPNDISIVAGIITSEFQTPLAHINVLSVNRGTPNMALRGASDNEQLRALEGKWVELTVGPFEWELKEVSAEEAESWWTQHKPEAITVQPMDLGVTDLRDVREILDLDSSELATAISDAIPAFGAKATNYGALINASTQGYPIPIQDGFAVPMYYYNQFMEDNGLWEALAARMADPDWNEPTTRQSSLEEFQEQMRSAPMRSEVVALLVEKAEATFPGENARFRSSTNSEDLGEFTGAGLYDSETGDPTIAGDEKDSVEWAVKKVWAQVWNPRAYEEREYYSMNHLDVGMALLVHANFPDEEANGVAITNNPYDPTGLEPGFYVNAQEGSSDVVSPEEGVTADAYLHYYYDPGQPIVYIQHSSLVPEGDTVLTMDESYDLATALDAVHTFFREAYGTTNAWYAMDVEWKFDDKYTPGEPALFIKQARPFPGWESDITGACAQQE